jgi:hypothetical protein
VEIDPDNDMVDVRPFGWTEDLDEASDEESLYEVESNESRTDPDLNNDVDRPTMYVPAPAPAAMANKMVLRNPFDPKMKTQRLTSGLYRVSRASMMALDREVLERQCKVHSVKQFCNAILQFAEWDDAAANDYYWPSFVTELLFDSDMLRDWLSDAQKHPLRAVRPFSEREHRWRLLMLLLVLQHLGVSDEYEVMKEEKVESVRVIDRMADNINTPNMQCSEVYMDLATEIANFDPKDDDDDSNADRYLLALIFALYTKLSHMWD